MNKNENCFDKCPFMRSAHLLKIASIVWKEAPELDLDTVARITGAIYDAGFRKSFDSLCDSCPFDVLRCE